MLRESEIDVLPIQNPRHMCDKNFLTGVGIESPLPPTLRAGVSDDLDIDPVGRAVAPLSSA
jgi:hypothetical protein